MEPFLSSKTAFNLVPKNNLDSQGDDFMENQCKTLTELSHKIQISHYEKSYINYPFYLKLILSIIASLLSSCSESLVSERKKEFFKNPFSTHIRLSLLKLIGSIIEKRLFESQDCQKYFDEISFSLLFKQYVFSLIVSMVAQNSNYLNLQKLIGFYKSITSEHYLLYVPLQLYFLYGGGVFTIEALTFKEKLTQLIQTLGKTLSNSESLMTRNIEDFKKNKDRNVALEQSIRVVMLSKNKMQLQETVNAIAQSIFNGQTYLKKQQFLYAFQAHTIDPLLKVLIEILRAEALLIEQIDFKNAVLNRNEVSKGNFYANQMQKILSKCPFNGDEKCDCKKCQCVRRNRESAKLNQQKKRNAVQQLEPMKKKMEDLEGRNECLYRRNQELEEENSILKKLLNQIKESPTFNNLLMQALEPMSKILHDSQ